MRTSLSSRTEKFVRSFLPSGSMLSYNPVFKFLGNGASNLYAVLSPQTRGLPPNHLRVRVGLTNQPLFNHVRYLTDATHFWLGCLANGYVDLGSNIVDVGVGCGRCAHILRDFSFYGQRFSGTYTGIDIDAEQIEWCGRNFDPERFRFFLSGQQSSSYKGVGGSGNGFEPLADESQDLVFSRSLYSHLLEDQIRAYSESALRVLRPGRFMLMTYFSLTTPPPTFGSRHTFGHRAGLAYIESEEQPTAAVAYHDADLRDLLEAIGFSEVSFTTDPGMLQQMIIARK